MRLINADDFFNDFPELRDYEYASQEYEVEAIPIERIKKWDTDKNKDFYDCCKLLIDDFNKNDVKRIYYKDMPPYNTTQALLEDWERERC